MATTFTVQDAITFTRAYIKQQSLYVNNMQPALGAAQIVLNILLGPPFIWRTNRANASFAISQGGGTDYQQAIQNFGWIENTWLVDGSGKFYQVGGKLALAKTGTQKQPTEVAPQYDDNQGNITFRINSVPDKAYTLYIDFQQKAPLVTGPTQPLGTISDENADLFFEGMLTWASLLVNDARFPIFEKQFISHLLSRQDGLDEQSKAIFMGEWMQVVRSVQRSQSSAQNGNAGRGM